MDDKAIAEGVMENVTKEAQETLNRYEIERKNEEAAYKKQQRQQLKAQCLMSAIETVKHNIDLDVLTEARKYYAWIRS